jgi:hypothetical protein
MRGLAVLGLVLLLGGLAALIGPTISIYDDGEGHRPRTE